MAISTSQQQAETGSGQLFYIMGASGAGKDTLLRGFQEHPGAGPGTLVAHRYITRAPGDGTENHVPLSNTGFEQRVTRGDFAMHWSANGYRYGIDREIDLWLAQGSQVLVNGSRGYLDQALSRYGNTLVPVLVSVDLARLQQRLVLRGREPAEEIDARIRRARELEQQLPPGCLIVENNGSVAEAVSGLLAAVNKRRASQTAGNNPAASGTHSA